MNVDLGLDLNPYIGTPARKDYGIGAVGAGFIMRDVHLKAYVQAGFNVAAITSRTHEIAQEVADLRGIPRVYDTIEEMLEDESVQILDIAVPPHEQLELIRKAVTRGRFLKAILAQKPLAVNLEQASETVRLCEEHQIPRVRLWKTEHDYSKWQDCSEGNEKQQVYARRTLRAAAKKEYLGYQYSQICRARNGWNALNAPVRRPVTADAKTDGCSD